MKKLISYVLIILVGIFAVAVFSTKSAYSPTEGELIKVASDAGVYRIENGKRRLFPNAKVFWTYYTGSWSSIQQDGQTITIKTISQFDFDNLDREDNITVKSGNKIVRFKNSPRLYTVFDDNKLNLISDQEASSIYGNNYANNVVVIQIAFEDDYVKDDTGFVDSDGDGISDEDEENLYNTDPNNIDSDNDGYKDGEEVANGYDPNTRPGDSGITSGDGTTTCFNNLYPFDGGCANSPRSCYLYDDDGMVNANGKIIWRDGAWSDCEFDSCISGLTYQDGECINITECLEGTYLVPGTTDVCNPDTISCTVENGEGSKAWNRNSNSWGECIVTKCYSGYHEESGQCLDNTKTCDVGEYGEGVQTWTNGSWSGCVFTQCKLGDLAYHLEDGVCVKNIKSCDDEIENGTGLRSWNFDTNTWGACYVNICDLGYVKNYSTTPNTCREHVLEVRDFRVVDNTFSNTALNLYWTSLMQSINEYKIYDGNMEVIQDWTQYNIASASVSEFDEQDHQVYIDELEPGATYYFQVRAKKYYYYHDEQFLYSEPSEIISYTLPIED